MVRVDGIRRVAAHREWRRRNGHEARQSWSAALAIGHTHGSSGIFQVAVRTTTANGANFTSPLGGRLTEYLVSGPLLARILGVHDGVAGAIPAQVIPKSAALVCQPWGAQALVLGGGFADLSSATAGVVGTQ